MSNNIQLAQHLSLSPTLELEVSVRVTHHPHRAGFASPHRVPDTLHQVLSVYCQHLVCLYFGLFV